MGRRSQHTPEQLRTLIVDSAQSIVEKGGVAKLSAREIARAIGYAPGTLYNMFENLDEILLRVELKLLQELDTELGRSTDGATGTSAILRYGMAYVTFAHSRPRLWCLLNEHQPAPETSLPEWYVAALQAPVQRLESPLAEALGTDDRSKLRLPARTMWRMIHGVTMLSTSSKLGPIEARDAEAQIKDLIGNYLAGLVAGQAKRSAAVRTSKSNGRLSEAR